MLKLIALLLCLPRTQTDFFFLFTAAYYMLENCEQVFFTLSNPIYFRKQLCIFRHMPITSAAST